MLEKISGMEIKTNLDDAVGVTLLTTITPTDTYKGKTVQFRVTIEGSRGAVLYARGSIG